MHLPDLLNLPKRIRKNPPKTLLASVSLVVLVGLGALYQGYCSEKGKRLASEPGATAPSAAPDRAGEPADRRIRVESKGNYSPNIVGNRGEVNVEINPTPEEGAKEEKTE